MNKKLISVAVALALLGAISTPTLAANKDGAKCTTPGQIAKVASKRLVCARISKTLKWVLIPAKVATPPSSPVTPTTVSANTTSTTLPSDKTKPVVTLLRSYGTSVSLSAAISFIVTGDKDLDCATLSTVIGEDFSVTRISRINSIVQTSSKVCTVNVQSTAERDGQKRESILAATSSFSISDDYGNVQTTLAGSPQSIWVTRSTS